MKGLTICLLLFVDLQGTTTTGCNTYEETAIHCKFPTDISSTKTNFAVYFQSDNGKRELLIDCGWLDDQLECIEQEGLECKKPVSDIAEISLPTRFTSRPGSYICLPEGYNPQDSKPCQFVENQQKDQNHLDQKAEKDISTTTIIAITGAFLGGVTIGIVTVMLVKRWKKRRSSKRRPKSDIADVKSVLTEDVSDSVT